MAWKVLIAEKIADEGIDALKQRGLSVVELVDAEPDELKAAIADADALIVRSATHVDDDLLSAAPKLKVIGRAGVTVDNIDIEAADVRGVMVCNAPTSNIISAAEHTMALLLAAARNVCQANASVHSGSWARHRFMGCELYGKTLAIFGLGRIGSLVAERAKAFGMELIAYDPYCSPERASQLDVTLMDSVQDILPKADFITVHLPLTEQTYGMFGPEEYAAMKTGVILVNPARGGIFQLDSLADFLAAGKIGAVAIDVFEEEPCTDSPLHEFSNAILTPHISAVTHEAQVRAGCEIAEYIWAALEGSIVPTVVNPSSIPPEVMDEVRPYIPAAKMAGRMISNLTGIPEHMTVQLEGSLADRDAAPLLAGVVDGILGYKDVGSMTIADAKMMAARHGMQVDVSTAADAQGYESAIRVMADGSEVAFTLYGLDRNPRLISFNGYRIDIAPAPSALVFEYVDSPGRIGTIGSILGRADVNITTMQIGVKHEEKCALVYMNVEGDVTPQVMEELEGAMDYKEIWQISM
ncbi:MAG: phosphoglycerate dehydrogenase [Eggerthellaceae bacterium]|nr:phosphoglycerate dehydrogenase [Eggerthellaceae bacterium]